MSGHTKWQVFACTHRALWAGTENFNACVRARIFGVEHCMRTEVFALASLWRRNGTVATDVHLLVF